MRTCESWGRYPRAKPEKILPLYWRDEAPDLSLLEKPLLGYGLGRSYGDSCLNENGVLLDTSRLSRFMLFDEKDGILRCEAGTSLVDILSLIVPKGWFLPVTPGTKFVTIAGAIANDVHGKNHHRSGAFGCFVRQFEILRSDGRRLICSTAENRELFNATIGGMGLTGLILWAEIKLMPISNPFIEMETIRFENIEEFSQLSESSDKEYEYVVSWVDCTARGRSLGRGIFIRGNHAPAGPQPPAARPKQRQISFPMDAPEFLLNKMTISLFNTLYYRKQRKKHLRRRVHYEPFFYPLDAIRQWNRMYGKRGFFQYQCVLPFREGYRATREILERISRSGNASFLSVLKTFGDIPSPGMMSFPRPGITLALDFPNQGEKTLRFFRELDEVVLQSGGALYPAKDARMSKKMFESSYPGWREFARYIDPKFSSSFWRRVTAA